MHDGAVRYRLIERHCRRDRSERSSRCGAPKRRIVRGPAVGNGGVGQDRCKTRGVELQRIDSDIASSVLVYLRHRGICCLPVHDSFVVPASAEFTLGQTMALAYQAKLTDHTDVRAYPAIKGWSSPDVEGRVFDTLARADERSA